MRKFRRSRGFVLDFVGCFSRQGLRIRGSHLYLDLLRKLKFRKGIVSPFIVVEKAVENGRPLVKIFVKKVGSSFYKIPLFLNKLQGTSVSLRWVRKAAMSGNSGLLIERLVKEIDFLHFDKGLVVKWRDELHGDAVGNRGFIKFMKKRKKKKKKKK